MQWHAYVDEFHRGRPGITELVLRRSALEDRDPYGWLVSAVPEKVPVLDVACGSAPLAPLLGVDRYFGLDNSAAELGLAARRAGGRLVQGSAAALPFPDAAFGAVTCSMALQILEPLPQALAEIGRVLAPGGRLIATVPATGPLRWRDAPLVAGLMVALARRVGYPNDRRLRDAAGLLADAGLRLAEDVSLRFAYRLGSAADAERLFASLYLPGLGPRRARAGRAWLRAAARAGAEMPVPIRRIIAVKTTSTSPRQTQGDHEHHGQHGDSGPRRDRGLGTFRPLRVLSLLSLVCPRPPNSPARIRSFGVDKAVLRFVRTH